MKAEFSGKYAYRGLVPMAKAIEIMGDDTPRTNQMYLGYHGHLLTFPIANGSIMNGNVFMFSHRIIPLTCTKSSVSPHGLRGLIPTGWCKLRETTCLMITGTGVRLCVLSWQTCKGLTYGHCLITLRHRLTTAPNRLFALWGMPHMRPHHTKALVRECALKTCIYSVICSHVALRKLTSRRHSTHMMLCGDLGVKSWSRLVGKQECCGSSKARELATTWRH